MRFKAIFITCVCTLIVLTACSTKPPTDAPLVLSLGAEPSMLNPILSTDSPSSAVNGYIFNGLLKVNPDLELVPDLAQTYHVSDDGLTFTFTLKPNITWHDETPFSTDDILFTYQKILDVTTNTVRRSDYIINGKPIVIKVLDKQTIQFQLPTPFAPILNRFTMGIIPKHIFENEDINTSAYNQNPIGTGPFTFTRWEPAQFVLLKRNPNYFDTLPKLKTVLLKIIPDQNTALISFEKEEVYSAGIPGKDFERIKQLETFNTFQFYDLAYTFLGFNCKNPLFESPVLRQAIAMSINKQSIVDGILLGYGKPAHLPTSPEMWTYPKTHFNYDYNPQQALTQLQQAGFKYDEQNNILYKDNQPVTFKIITNKGNKDREKAAVMIQDNLKNIGIKVAVQLMEWSSFIAVVNANQDPKDYDAVILGWSLGLDPDGYSLWHSSQYPQGFNFIGYQNDQVDQWLHKGRTTIDRTQRQAIYKKLYNKIAQDAPYVFLYYPESLVGIHRKVSGLSPAGPAGLFNPIENISIVQ